MMSLLQTKVAKTINIDFEVVKMFNKLYTNNV